MIFFFLFLLVSADSFAYFVDEVDPHANKKTFNEMSLTQFGDFAKNWHLVTVRFRKDSGEMRFTFANPSAWKTMRANSVDFKKGAVFAKISIITAPDPAFESSAAPSGAKRVQFMVKDAKKYKETDGWGYALFKGDGLTFPGEPKPVILACHACHQLVPERGFVFSQPADLASLSTAMGKASPHLPPSAKGVSFETVSVEALPEQVRALLDPNVTQVRKLRSVITKHVFYGTLDEIRPTLLLENQKTDLPILLLSDDLEQFSILATPRGPGKACSAGSKSMVFHKKSTSDRAVVSEPFCL